MNDYDKLFTIQQLSIELNVPKSTLRFWEKELPGVFNPIRTQGKQRRYTQAHLIILEKIKDFRNQGLSLVEIRHKLGSNGNGNQQPNGKHIEILADRVAEVVKKEVHRFFYRETMNCQNSIEDFLFQDDD